MAMQPIRSENNVFSNVTIATGGTKAGTLERVSAYAQASITIHSTQAGYVFVAHADSEQLNLETTQNDLALDEASSANIFRVEANQKRIVTCPLSSAFVLMTFVNRHVGGASPECVASLDVYYQSDAFPTLYGMGDSRPVSIATQEFQKVSNGAKDHAIMMMQRVQYNGGDQSNANGPFPFIKGGPNGETIIARTFDAGDPGTPLHCDAVGNLYVKQATAFTSGTEHEGFTGTAMTSAVQAMAGHSTLTFACGSDQTDVVWRLQGSITGTSHFREVESATGALEHVFSIHPAHFPHYRISGARPGGGSFTMTSVQFSKR